MVIDRVRFRTLLDVVAKIGRSGERYVAFFAVLYFAGLRPVEAIALRADDLTLPDNGWGAIAVRRGLTAPGRRFVDEGQSHEVRGLKWRAMGAVRHVPIPPELVKLLREHLDRWGAGETGLVFTNEAGQPLSRSRYARVFSAAKSRAFAKGDPLLESAPYDLRHANATLLLNAGVPIPEVARRLGHSPEILLRIYAGVMHQDEAVANERVERLLDDFTGGWFREDR